jgi:chromosome segregation ATPase
VSKKLNKTINNYKDQIVNSNKLNEKLQSKRLKYNDEINRNMKRLMGNKDEFKNQKSSINQMKSEKQNIINEKEKIKEETRILKEQIILENNNLNELNKQVQKLNNSISKLTKEKDNIIKKLKALNRQKDIARNKVNKQFEKNSNFMLDVNELLKSSRPKSIKTRPTSFYK